MRRFSLALAAVALTFLVFMPAHAEAGGKKGGPFGLGVIFGEPTGLTGKYWFSGTEALDFHLGVQGFDNNSHSDVGIYVDYLYHFDIGVGNSVFSMPLYLGPGGNIVIDDDDRYCDKWGCYDYDDGRSNLGMAIRMPFGLAFLFSRFPGEAFIELSLQMWIIPATHLDADAALGFRFYF